MRVYFFYICTTKLYKMQTDYENNFMKNLKHNEKIW